MRKQISTTLLALATLSSAYAYTSKICREDVCKITEGDKVRWEGPKDKVAEIKKAEKAKEERIQKMLDKIAGLPRKAAGEKIRLAVFNSYASSSMQPYQKEYFNKLVSHLKATKKYEVIDEKQYEKEMNAAAMRMALKSDWNKNDPSSDFDKARRPGDYVPLSEKVKEAQLLGVPVDAIVQLGYDVELKHGVLKGKGGAGVAEVDYPKFSAKVTSIYKYDPKDMHFVGKSTTRFSVAGVDKKGKVSGGELKGAKRNVTNDDEALKQLAGFIMDTTNTHRKIMPTIASLDKYHGRNVASVPEVPKKMNAAKTKKAMKKLKKKFKF